MTLVLNLTSTFSRLKNLLQQLVGLTETLNLRQTCMLFAKYRLGKYTRLEDSVSASLGVEQLMNVSDILLVSGKVCRFSLNVTADAASAIFKMTNGETRNSSSLHPTLRLPFPHLCYLGYPSSDKKTRYRTLVNCEIPFVIMNIQEETAE